MLAAQQPLVQIFQILKCLKDPTRAISFKSIRFKDIKYDILVCHECHECYEGLEGHEGHEGHED